MLALFLIFGACFATFQPSFYHTSTDHTTAASFLLQYATFARKLMAPRVMQDSVSTATFDYNMQSLFSLSFAGNK